MSKITLNSIGDLTQSSTAQTVINNNSTVVQTAFDNTLSRDGTSPNQMAASLDMNSNRILNLPTPISTVEPVSLGYLNGILAGNPLISGLVSGVPVSAAMQPVVNAGTTTIARQLLGVNTNGTVFYPQMFGAVGDNVHDDTTAIQLAINAAQAVPRGVVEFPPGLYKVTSTLNITSGIALRGVGYNSVYKPLGGSQLIIYGAIIGVSVVTDDAIFVDKLGFTSAGSAITLFTVNTDNSAFNTTNVLSVFRDCMFVGGQFGINAPGIGLYTLDNCNFQNQSNISCQTDIVTAQAGGGDCNITNCVFSGAPSNGHFRTGTLGGMRIVNNKFNSSNGTSSIGFISSVVSSVSMSPIIISGNSIEGTIAGIFFQGIGSGTINANNIVIVGNEIACTGSGSSCISVSQRPANATQWVTGGVISGNFLTANNGTPLTHISLNACADFTITGNQFMANAAATAIALGGNTARITQANNGKGLNVT